MTISEIIDENIKPSTSSLQSSSSSSSLNNNDKTIQELSDRKNEELQIESVSPEIPKDIQKYIAGKLIPIINNFDNSVEGPSSNIIVNENNFENVGGPITIGDVIHLHLDAAETDLIALNSKNNNQYRESSNISIDPSICISISKRKLMKKCFTIRICVLFVVLLLILLIIATTIGLLFVYFNNNNEENSSISTLTEPSSVEPKHYFITRRIWGARAPSETLPILKVPVSLIIIKHTKSERCYEVRECFSAMQALQYYDVGNMNLPDIAYNFVIAEDGNVYDGRGWERKNSQSKLENYEDSLDLAFMGNYEENVPGKFMIETGRWWIETGVKLGYIRKNFKILCHNQTEPNTESPGKNLVKEVRTWKGYSEEILY